MIELFSYSKEQITTPKANPGGTTGAEEWVIRFHIKSIDEVSKTIDWHYADEATLDTDLTALEAEITTTI